MLDSSPTCHRHNCLMGYQHVCICWRSWVQLTLLSYILSYMQVTFFSSNFEILTGYVTLCVGRSKASEGNISYIALLPGQYLDIAQEGGQCPDIAQESDFQLFWSTFWSNVSSLGYCNRKFNLYIFILMTFTCGIEFLY